MNNISKIFNTLMDVYNKRLENISKKSFEDDLIKIKNEYIEKTILAKLDHFICGKRVALDSLMSFNSNVLNRYAIKFYIIEFYKELAEENNSIKSDKESIDKLRNSIVISLNERDNNMSLDIKMDL